MTASSATFSGGIAVGGAETHSLQQAPPLALKGVNWCCGDGVPKTTVLLEKPVMEHT